MEVDNRRKLGNISLFVTVGEECFAITQHAVTKIDNLTSSQEEADTRHALQESHAAKTFQNLRILTDVFVILFSLHAHIEGKIPLRQGEKNNIRLIDIPLLATIVGKSICTALLGVHACTGCDSVNAFAGQGKLKNCT